MDFDLCEVIGTSKDPVRDLCVLTSYLPIQPLDQPSVSQFANTLDWNSENAKEVLWFSAVEENPDRSLQMPWDGNTMVWSSVSSGVAGGSASIVKTIRQNFHWAHAI